MIEFSLRTRQDVRAYNQSVRCTRVALGMSTAECDVRRVDFLWIPERSVTERNEFLFHKDVDGEFPVYVQYDSPSYFPGKRCSATFPLGWLPEIMDWIDRGQNPHRPPWKSFPCHCNRVIWRLPDLCRLFEKRHYVHEREAQQYWQERADRERMKEMELRRTREVVPAAINYDFKRKKGHENDFF